MYTYGYVRNVCHFDTNLHKYYKITERIELKNIASGNNALKY